MNKTSVAHLIIVLSTLAPLSAWAQPRLPHAPSDQEILMLPEECKIIFKGTQEQKKLFYQQFPDLVGPNHYCNGMNYLNRARFSSLNKIEKRFNLQSAINEFDYVLRHSKSNAKGLQQIELQKQQAELQLKLLK
jgi:hypothetical protein